MPFFKEELKEVTAYFSPKIVTTVNDQYVKVAKIKGQDVPWHNHEKEDELFYIIEGTLLMEVENEAIIHRIIQNVSEEDGKVNLTYLQLYLERLFEELS